MDALEPSDVELGDRVRGGDTGAYAHLWSRHVHAGIAAARQFASIADPEDIVSEAHLRILRAMQDGGGPREAFRPYLYRTVRNIALDWRRGAPQTTELTDDFEDAGPSPQDAAENTITVRAFRTLPERWQTVLWYTEVEGMDPAEAAPLLGLSPNSAAALAYRAREGLKKAWLQAHVSDARVPPGCRWTTDRMGDYARGALSPKARARFDEHLETCTRCSILVEEIDGLSGRLAAILLPATLGGVAGSAFLAQLGAADPAQAAAPPSETVTTALGGAGKTTLVAVATAGGAALVAAALVLGTVFAPGGEASSDGPADAPPAESPVQSDPPAQTPIAPPDSEPAPPPASPPAPVPPPAPVAPVEPTPPDPDTVAPIAPVLSTPDGLLTNDPRPVFAGLGEPAAAVVLTLLDSAGLLVGAPLRTTVGQSGTWSLTPAAPLPDGPYRVEVTQVDAAGNVSPAVAIGLVVDTVALPPAVELPVEPQVFLPVIGGTAEASGIVEVRDELGALLGTATVDAEGAWSLQLPDSGRDELVLSAVLTDPAGNVSDAAVAGPIVFERPWFPGLVDGVRLPSDNGATELEVELAGIAGLEVEVLVDGVPTGNVHVLEDAPIVRVTPVLADGEHSLSMRYIDSATGAVGALATVRFVLEP